jgi:hypothetical protein
MLCAELEQMEGQIDDILTALENPRLTEQEREALERSYAELSHAIKEHQKFGHHGAPCFEE